MSRARRWFGWWVALLDWLDFYVPADVSPDLPRSLAEHRARKAALLRQLDRLDRAKEIGT